MGMSQRQDCSNHCLLYSEQAAEYINVNGCYTFQKNADENETGCRFPSEYVDVFQLKGYLYYISSAVLCNHYWAMCESKGKHRGSCIVS